MILKYIHSLAQALFMDMIILNYYKIHSFSKTPLLSSIINFSIQNTFQPMKSVKSKEYQHCKANIKCKFKPTNNN